jgi:hypothetical protein
VTDEILRLLKVSVQDDRLKNSFYDIYRTDIGA